MSFTLDNVLELVWTQTWQLAALGGIVAGVVKLGCRQRPHLAYLLWMLVVVKAITPPVWSSPTGLFSWATAETVRVPIATAPPAPASDTIALVPTFAGSEEAGEAGGERQKAEGRRQKDVGEADVAPVGSAAPRVTWRGGLVTVWSLGALAMAGMVWVRWLGLLRLVRETRVAVEPAMQRQFEALRQQINLRRPVRLVLTSAPLGPAAFGWWRGTVIVPASLAHDKTSAELSQIFAHELIHLRRFDTLAGQFQLLAQILWWFHPSVWLANRQARVERERACDEEVVAELGCPPADYARLLVQVLQWRHHLTPALLWPGMRAWDVTSARLKYMLHHGHPFRRRASLASWLIAACGLALALPGAALRFSVAEDQPPGPNTFVKADPEQSPADSTFAKALPPDEQAAMAELEKLGVEFSWLTHGKTPKLTAGFSRTFKPGDRPLPLGKLPSLTSIGTDYQGDAEHLREQLRALVELLPTTQLVASYSAGNAAGLDALASIHELAKLALVPIGDNQAKDANVTLPAAALAKLRSLAWHGIRKDQLPQVIALVQLESLQLTGDLTAADLEPLAKLTKLNQLLLARMETKEAQSLDMSFLDQMPEMADLAVFSGFRPDENASARIGKLAKLWRLRVDLSGMNDAALADIARAKNLRVFDSFTQSGAPRLTSQGLAALGALTNLTRLSIHLYGQDPVGPFITDESVATWPALTKLKSLSLCCRLDDAGLESIGRLKSLTSLSLVGEIKSTERGVAAIGNLTNLRELTLADTGLTDATLARLRALAGLEKLTLVQATALTDDGLAQIAEFGKLASLAIHESKITGTGAQALGQLSNLRSLTLAGSPVNDAGLAAIAGLARLHELHLSDTAITDDGMAAFRGHLAELSKLDLAEAAISDRGFEALADHKKLHELRTFSPKLTAAGKQKLKQAIPGLQVIDQEWGTFVVVDDDEYAPDAEPQPAAPAEPKPAPKSAPPKAATAPHQGNADKAAAAIAELERLGVQVQSAGGGMGGGLGRPITKSYSVTIPPTFQPTGQPLPLAKVAGLIGVIVGVQPALGLQSPRGPQPTTQQLRDQILAAKQLPPGALLNISCTAANAAALDALASIPQLEHLALNLQESAPLPDALERLQNLRSLTLSGLSKTDLAGLGSLKKLEHVSLSGAMTEPFLRPLAKLGNLKTLNLSHDFSSREAVTLDLAFLDGTPNLEKLLVHGMYTVSADAAARIGKLGRLRELSADISAADDAGVRQLGAARQLETVYLHAGFGAGKLSGGALAGLGSLVNLQKLYYSGQTLPGRTPLAITDESLAGWQGLGKLQSLHLDPCRITDAGLVEIGQLKSLVKLQLSGGLEITDQGLAPLGAPTKLETLVLDNASINGSGLAALARVNLKELSLKDSAVDDRAITTIAAHRTLVALDLAGTKISDQGLAELARHLPDLTRLSLARTQITDQGFTALLNRRKLNELDAADTKLTVALLGKMLKENPDLRVWAADAMTPQTAGGGWNGRFQAIQVE